MLISPTPYSNTATSSQVAYHRSSATQSKHGAMKITDVCDGIPTQSESLTVKATAVLYRTTPTREELAAAMRAIRAFQETREQMIERIVRASMDDVDPVLP